MSSKTSTVTPVVAVVGTGFIGPVHVEALKRLNINVKGILGSSLSKSQAAATSLGVPVAYASFEDILNNTEVTAVHITSPNHLHAPQARAVLEAGKHVICEKPLALNTQETAELVEVARNHPQQIAAVNYNIRYYPLMIHARDVIARGELGEIYTVTGCYVQDWLLKDSDWNWRLEPGKGGALRAVGDIGTHWMDLVSFVTGQRVTRVLADLETFVKTRQKPAGSIATFTGKLEENQADAQYDPVNIEPVNVETEDYGAVLFHYASGARGLMNVSQVSAGRKNQLRLEVAGSQGSLAWDSETPNQLWLGHRDKGNEIIIKDPALVSQSAQGFINYPGGHTEGFPDTFKQLYQDIYGYIARGDVSLPKPFPTFEDGHAEVLLCEKILESHQQRAWRDV
ncbi:MAG: Gfo/Idh/MocA family oxidoreductase [Deinococcota bacterium]